MSSKRSVVIVALLLVGALLTIPSSTARHDTSPIPAASIAVELGAGNAGATPGRTARRSVVEDDDIRGRAIILLLSVLAAKEKLSPGPSTASSSPAESEER